MHTQCAIITPVPSVHAGCDNTPGSVGVLPGQKCMVLSYALSQGVVLPLAGGFGDVQSLTAGMLMLSICIKRLCNLT